MYYVWSSVVKLNLNVINIKTGGVVVVHSYIIKPKHTQGLLFGSK